MVTLAVIEGLVCAHLVLLFWVGDRTREGHLLSSGLILKHLLVFPSQREGNVESGRFLHSRLVNIIFYFDLNL